MGAKFCIENKTNRPIVIQIEQISVRYCCWIEPRKRAVWHPDRKGTLLHQGFYTLRVIDPSLNYKPPNMKVENGKAVIGGILIGVGGAGIVASAAMMGVGMTLVGDIIGAGVLTTAVIVSSTSGAISTCTAREYRPAIRRGLHIGRGTKCEIRSTNNQFEIIPVRACLSVASYKYTTHWHLQIDFSTLLYNIVTSSFTHASLVCHTYGNIC